MKFFLLNVSNLQTYRQICCKFTRLSSNEFVRVYTLVINRIYRPFQFTSLSSSNSSFDDMFVNTKQLGKTTLLFFHHVLSEKKNSHPQDHDPYPCPPIQTKPAGNRNPPQTWPLCLLYFMLQYSCVRTLFIYEGRQS